MLKRLIPSLLVLAAACSPSTPTAPETALAAPAIQLDCFRETGAAMLAAHRAGPAPGYPENALSTLHRLAELGVLYAEIDVRRSADGMLFLLHDDTLDRTTTGTGSLDGLAWDALSGTTLRDPDGTIVEDTIPTLADALTVAREAGLVLNLDLKSVSPEEIVGFVHDHDARDEVAIIAYSIDQAAAIHALDDGLLLSAPNDPAALSAAGANLDAVYIWTGVGAADADQDARLAEAGLETSAGLFRLENGDPAVYQTAAAAGVELLSIDDVDTAVVALGGAEALQAQIAACTPD
ncbi:glycerophosphodiester phosphodiesterase family protein [Maricaulis sp.]|uniref:glycerophosphodiester phosphodiesterase family protein n=1 Tax=Maricaulis sp. TaxID=1486257 RepID=UPI001B27C245|nr:glycerophosphodiester phosphodiesterase family protein [Maricaulis sp.]MBO6763421.1 glycerophosphodiester phosphodiesterase family protein [Maricaulis sp.]